MAFDECIENPAPRDYVQKNVDRTYRWLVRCKAENARLNALPDTVNSQQMLWGINQGGTYTDIRVDRMKRIAELDLPGYAIGGLAVGETTHQEILHDIIDKWRSTCQWTRPATSAMENLGRAQQHHRGGRPGRGFL